MNLPCTCFIPAAKVNDANAVLNALGYGPQNFIRKLCGANPNATWETPPTHYLFFDQTSSDVDVAKWQGLKGGTIPDPVSGSWGDGINPSLGTATSACALLTVASVTDDVEPLDFLLGKVDPETGMRLSGGGMLGAKGLQFVPDPPL